MSAPDLHRNLTAVELRHLTDETDTEDQRAWLDLHGVRHTRRLHVDEVTVWIDEHVDALLDGFRDPAVGSYGALPASCPLAAAVAA